MPRTRDEIAAVSEMERQGMDTVADASSPGQRQLGTMSEGLATDDSVSQLEACWGLI